MAAQDSLPFYDMTIPAFGQKTKKYVFGKTNSLGNQTDISVKNAQQLTSGMRLHHKYQDLLEKLESDFRAELRELYSNEVKLQIETEIGREYPVALRAELKAQLEPKLTKELIQELKEELRKQLESQLRQDIEADLRKVLQPAVLAELNVNRQEANAARERAEQHDNEPIIDSRQAQAVTKGSKYASRTSGESSMATRAIDQSERDKSPKRTRDDSQEDVEEDIPRAKRRDQRRREYSVGQDNVTLGAQENTYGANSHVVLQEESSNEADDCRSRKYHPDPESGGMDANVGIRMIHEGVAENLVEQVDDGYDACLEALKALQDSEDLDSSIDEAGSSTDNMSTSTETAGSSVETAGSSAENVDGSSTHSEIGSSIKNPVDLEESDSDGETIELPRTTPPMGYNISNDLLSRYYNNNEVPTYNGRLDPVAQDYVSNSVPFMRQAAYDDVHGYVPGYDFYAEAYDDLLDYEYNSHIIRNGRVESQGSSVLERLHSQYGRQSQESEDEEEYEDEDTLVDEVGVNKVAITLQNEGESDHDYIIRLAREEEQKAHEYEEEEEEEEEL